MAASFAEKAVVAAFVIVSVDLSVDFLCFGCHFGHLLLGFIEQHSDSLAPLGPHCQY